MRSSCSVCFPDKSAKPVQGLVLNTGSNHMEGPLDVPEEPTKDDDYDDDIAEQSKDRDGEAKRSALSFFTAASIARWMAKAYGYAARKKAMYDSQDRVSDTTLLRTVDHLSSIKVIVALCFSRRLFLLVFFR